MSEKLKQLLEEKAYLENKIRLLENNLSLLENEICQEKYGFGIGDLVEYEDYVGIVSKIESGFYGWGKMNKLKKNGGIAKVPSVCFYYNDKFKILKRVDNED